MGTRGATIFVSCDGSVATASTLRGNSTSVTFMASGSIRGFRASSCGVDDVRGAI